MRNRRGTLGLVLAMLLAGCATPTGPSDVATTSFDVDTQGTDESRPEAPDVPDEVPSTASPPVFRVGDWWRIRVTDVFGGRYETTRVVAAVMDSHYMVGSPEKEFSDELLVLHLPGLGEVSQSDLSFDMHDAPFHPLKFPLTLGDTWKTAFEARPVDAEVISVSATTAEVEFTGASDHFVLTYDAAAGEVTRFQHETYAEFQVIARGHGFQGKVAVPYAQDLIFQHGRLGGALNRENGPAAPVDTISVRAGYDRASFVLIFAIAGPSPIAIGYMGEKVTAPDGTVFEASMATPEPGPFKVVTKAHDKVAGDWQLQHVVVGPGFAGAEGIAYKVLKVELVGP
ncbi:MAG: hypothetical protein HY556_10365 [Euryarchaeota archaeon]|nr:hypothetical protein [Euryarchaeota archaeon]